MASDGSDEKFKLYYRARQIVGEMAVDRGYLKSPQYDMITPAMLYPVYIKESWIELSFRNQANYIMIVCLIKDKLATDLARAIMVKYGAHDISLILVYDEKTTVEGILRSDVYPATIETFHISTLQFNPSRHVLTPSYKVLTDEEKKDFMKRNRLTTNQLKIIRIDDKLALYYGWKRGQLIRVTIEDQVNNLLSGSAIEHYIIG